jgi:large subunit ribosomal protein L3
MALGILARKVGMTQVFVDTSAVGATVVEAGPCRVVAIRTAERDGYNALQLGADPIDARKSTKPLLGHFAKAGVEPHRHLFEVRVDNPEEYTVGDEIGVGIFSEGDQVDVTGRSRGLGFQGVVKRWNFSGGPKSHGSHFHRRPGSIGQCVEPGRVIKGKKLPGHAGDVRVTIRKLRVLRVDEERNLLVLKGSTPGAKGTLLQVRRRDG